MTNMLHIELPELAPTRSDIRGLFTEQITKTYKSGYVEQIPVLPVFPPDYYIAVYREEDGYYEEPIKNGIIELHLLNSKGEWSGPSVSLSAPRIDMSWDEGYEHSRYVVKPAQGGSSSAGSTDPKGLRAEAIMLKLAADYVEAWTAEAEVTLKGEVDRKNDEYVVERAERKAKAEREQVRAEHREQRLNELVPVGSRVRVTVTNYEGKEKRYTGEIGLGDGPTLLVYGDDKMKPLVKTSLGREDLKIEVQVKPGGRFHEFALDA